MEQGLRQELQEILHKEIIATKVLEFDIAALNDEFLSLSAPIKTNINDKKTAFGGSIAALCMISGWSLCWLIARRAGLKADVVIYKSAMEFKRPLRKDFSTTVFFPDKAQTQKLLERLQSKKKTSLDLDITVQEDGQDCVIFSGKYVFIRS
ncbi:MAG: YiiD C-terminal domain-containing protein [Helicobacteraceae bacterium]